MSFSDLIFSYDNSLTSIISIKLVKKDIMDATVLLTAPEIVKHVDTLTASALVRRGGWALIVLKVYTNVKRRLKIRCHEKTSNLYKCAVSNIYLTSNYITMVLIFLDIQL